MKIHKGDDVLVLAGKFRGERAKVEEAMPPSSPRACVSFKPHFPAMWTKALMALELSRSRSVALARSGGGSRA